jgi:hypothetical protein
MLVWCSSLSSSQAALATTIYPTGYAGTVRVFRLEFTLEDAIEFHAFAPHEALPCM